MSILSDHIWKTKYTPEDGDLVSLFYVPALTCAVRYDRSTGFFSAAALALAMRGLEGLIPNGGRMCFLVGCTLEEPEVEAIRRGEDLRETVAGRLLGTPLAASEGKTMDALELLAWMVARGYLDVKVVVPCDAKRRPIAGVAIFHEKGGVIEDKIGDRIAFAGSINETEFGWRHNWESFHVFTTWEGSAAHVEAEDASFQTLWADRSKRAIVFDVPTAVRDELLKFLPTDDCLPRRLEEEEAPTELAQDILAAPDTADAKPLPDDPRRVVWSFIRLAPRLPNGGERVGEATSAVIPWPHQVRAFHRLYDHWPPKLLIADEVGLGKTIQAGMLLRQAWLSGRAGRILVLAPKAVLSQWQIELREKFNLNWPIYDGQKLSWYPSPGFRGEKTRAVERTEWHREPFLLVSSQLMRRRDRVRELCDDAGPWGLIILDEAHHARRHGGGTGNDDRPNQLLRLMQRLIEKTAGLVMLTATPMQVSPVEIWDLLNLLGLPPEWDVRAFLDFFEISGKPMPSHAELERMAALFRAVEKACGTLALEVATRFVPAQSMIKAKKILKALRDTAQTPRRQLEVPERSAAVRLMRANTPLRHLVSRHTRELLRRYIKAGRLSARIPDRVVEDRFVTLTAAERQVYEEVEDYISRVYHNAEPDERTAVGFVMTIYRRRLASSFSALSATLADRLASVGHDRRLRIQTTGGLDEDIPDDETVAEAMDNDEAALLEQEALALEEKGEIERLLLEVGRLGVDTKARVLKEVLGELRGQGGYQQVMMFTQYTDTMDFLRVELAASLNAQIICFSGRGGEVRGPDGRWNIKSRAEIKRLFRTGRAEIMLCTDAAAEGLNFQFCGALVNYDLPWNPMRVEQRIGRIDRLGQKYEKIRIVNLHEEPLRPEPPYGLPDLAQILRRPQLLPPGIAVTPTGKKDFSYMQPGMERPVRVTADPDFFDAHSDSAELWSPGSPLFPYEQQESPLSDVTPDEFRKAIE